MSTSYIWVGEIVTLHKVKFHIEQVDFEGIAWVLSLTLISY
jgi:hypothetical protein